MPRLVKITTPPISRLTATTPLNEVASRMASGSNQAEARHDAAQVLLHALVGGEAIEARSRKFLLIQGLHVEHPFP